MFTITYKNVLKENKKQDDFMNWLKVYWPEQQRWGATSIKLWNTTEGKRRVLFCQYTIQNIERWNREAVSPNAKHLIQDLSEVVEMDKMTIKISARNRDTNG